MSIRELLSFLPSNNMEDAPVQPCSDDIRRADESLMSVIPDDPNMPYDIKNIIEPVVDNHYFFEVMPHFAKNIVVGFARLGGRSVGIVANQPAYLAGVLDIDASDKASRFIRFCDCFNIPIVTFEDVPGFLPGCTQEHNGIIRHGAKIVYAYAEATVPKITVITRKAYGGAYIVMNSKPIGADVNFSYPTAEIAVMGADGAVNILYRKVTFRSFFRNESSRKNITEANIIRYHTSRPSFREISFPKIPVPPAMRMERCSFINASFI